jgi:hypothetical protein
MGAAPRGARARARSAERQPERALRGISIEEGARSTTACPALHKSCFLSRSPHPPGKDPFLGG